MSAGHEAEQGPFVSGPQSIPPSLQQPLPQAPYIYQHESWMQGHGQMYYNLSSTESSNAQNWGPAPTSYNAPPQTPLQPRPQYPPELPQTPSWSPPQPSTLEYPLQPFPLTPPVAQAASHPPTPGSEFRH
ncbi:hypothetical protein F5Y06DRAFT_281866 [Hypoxylon sp. FL0890]|nr:hypothetical protein F5Y06DRAFT_281866 [Hypoxylon sp. FL0890]